MAISILHAGHYHHSEAGHNASDASIYEGISKGRGSTSIELLTLQISSLISSETTPFFEAEISFPIVVKPVFFPPGLQYYLKQSYQQSTI